mmetsp:Transcript_139019/g.443936  ORF Transcript_139019/g.443936 Transcript_139019/m.443936 type:complete len:267 (-) Transcript_139019:877-1677(-)
MRQRVPQPIHHVRKLELAQLSLADPVATLVGGHELLDLRLREALAPPDRRQQSADVLEDQAHDRARRAQLLDALGDDLARDGVTHLTEETRELSLRQGALPLHVELREERAEVRHFLLEPGPHDHQKLAPTEGRAAVLVEVVNDFFGLLNRRGRAEPTQGTGQLVRGYLARARLVVAVEDGQQVIGLAFREAVSVVHNLKRLLKLGQLNFARLVDIHLIEDLRYRGLRHRKAQVPQQVAKFSDVDGARTVLVERLEGVPHQICSPV